MTFLVGVYQQTYQDVDAS